MQILHVVESFAGGVYDFIHDLVSGMPEESHTIIYSSRMHTPLNFQQHFPDNVKFLHWDQASREINPIQDYKAYKQLYSFIKPLLNDIDIVHLHSSKAGFLGRMVARQLYISEKVIYTPHGVSFLRKDVSSTKHKIFIWLEKFGSLFGGTTVACSKSEMEEFHRYNIPAIYINNGYKCNIDSSMNHSDTQKLVIGTIGRISPQKNPSLFNEIALKFVDHKNITFLWIGDGELTDELNSNNIIKTGWVDRDKVNKYLETLDIYISTSLWEGLPLSVLQAMCAGKPLVLSDCVGNRDLVISGYNGILFQNETEAEKAILDIVRSIDKIMSYGCASKEYFSKSFTLDKMINNYYSLYQNIQKGML